MKRPWSKKELQHTSMKIVNNLFEMAEISVEKRQELNDKADKYVLEILISITKYKSPKKTEL